MARGSARTRSTTGLTGDSQASARAAKAPPADDARDDEEAFELSGSVGPVPGELGSPGGAEPAL